MTNPKEPKLTPINELPEGAVQVHMYPPELMLCPRGPMKKESLSLRIFEDLESTLESWTDPKYGDSISPEEALKVLESRLASEVKFAWNAFLEKLSDAEPSPSTAARPERNLPMFDVAKLARVYLDDDSEYGEVEDGVWRLVVEWSDNDVDKCYRLKYGTKEELQPLLDWLNCAASVTIDELEAEGFQTVCF